MNWQYRDEMYTYPFPPRSWLGFIWYRAKAAENKPHWLIEL
jgi:hypothetical protein